MIALHIAPLTLQDAASACFPNEPFPMIGRLLPVFSDSTWQYTEELLVAPGEKRYPDDNYNPLEFIDAEEKTMLVAYDQRTVAGRIVCSRKWNHFCFVEEIAVRQTYRGQGVGSALLAAAQAWAQAHHMPGFMLETQDVNLLACRFYIKQGFSLGAVDTHLYDLTPSKGELALFWYKMFA